MSLPPVWPPAERNRFLNLLGELSADTIIILSTHIVEDVKELCTDMAIINKGQVLMQGNPLKAIEKLAGHIWRKRVSREELPFYKENFNVISDKLMAGVPTIHVLANKMPEPGFYPMQPDLEDVYFSYIMAESAPQLAATEK